MEALPFCNDFFFLWIFSFVLNSIKFNSMHNKLNRWPNQILCNFLLELCRWMCLFTMSIHWWSKSKWFLTIIASIHIRYSTVNVRMLLEQNQRKNETFQCKFQSLKHFINFNAKHSGEITFSLVLSRKPRPQMVHLNRSRASIKWNFLCFIKAFLLADILPHIEHVSGFWICLTRMCSRIAFLLRDLQFKMIWLKQFDTLRKT